MELRNHVRELGKFLNETFGKLKDYGDEKHHDYPFYAEAHKSLLGFLFVMEREFEGALRAAMENAIYEVIDTVLLLLFIMKYQQIFFFCLYNCE